MYCLQIYSRKKNNNTNAGENCFGLLGVLFFYFLQKIRCKDKVNIQPKSKPEKTTISISGETFQRIEIYCQANGILRKDLSYSKNKFLYQINMLNKQVIRIKGAAIKHAVTKSVWKI